MLQATPIKFPLQILCWELVSKRGGSWVLHYVKSAYAVTDVPDQVSVPFVISGLWRPDIDIDRYRTLGPRVGLSTSSMAQRFFLRRDPQYFPFLLHIPFITHALSEVLDSRGDGIPTLQSDILLVCVGASEVKPVHDRVADGILSGQLLHLLRHSQ